MKRKKLQPEEQQIVDQLTATVQEKLRDAEGGHDWFHTLRVLNTAREIAQDEPVDLFTVELAALLHDIDDAKFNDGDEEAGARLAGELLRNAGVSETLTDHVQQIVRHVSFKGGNVQQLFSSPELDVVQDADRLDAIGAVGIARAFSYGGHKQRGMYDPHQPPQLKMTREQYRSSTAPTINHFYEKLLLLKERMNTPAGRRLAEQRHRFMEQFLEQFYTEWYGGELPEQLFFD